MPDHEDDALLNDEPIEAYCVSCKETIEIQDPIGVWTRRGQAATRGTCPVCGTNVFRMGRTHLHAGQKAPKPIEVVPVGAKGRKARATYIAAPITDADFAHGLGEELQKMGIHVWVDSGETVDDTAWSSGVHPALDQCTHLVVVLSSFAESTASVRDAWQYFQSQRKPVFVAQIEAIEPPDALRTRPRFDFTTDYKTAFRGLVEMLSR
ncbi:MAG: DUF5679 domain-containing protein [Anaerolineales bacterium]